MAPWRLQFSKCVKDKGSCTNLYYPSNQLPYCCSYSPFVSFIHHYQSRTSIYLPLRFLGIRARHNNQTRKLFYCTWVIKWYPALSECTTQENFALLERRYVFIACLAGTWRLLPRDFLRYIHKHHRNRLTSTILCAFFWLIQFNQKETKRKIRLSLLNE